MVGKKKGPTNDKKEEPEKHPEDSVPFVLVVWGKDTKGLPRST